jgi:aldehyde:ferredoxin oxidoreductase
MKGYIGRILKVNLSNRKTRVEPIKTEWIRMFLGGKGLGARYFLKETAARIDPLSPENVLIFMTGPLTGTKAPSFSRCGVISKSPATNTFCDSYFGGYFPAEIKFAGLDGIILEGRAQNLSVLTVVDGVAQINTRIDLKNLGTHETTKILKETSRLEKPKIAAVGPAAENLVRFSCISADKYHKAGRGGLGAVMASKNLKAIVVQGGKDVEVHDADGFRSCVKEIIEDASDNHDIKKMSREGTPHLVDEVSDAGILPTRNFQEGIFEKVNEMNWDAMKKCTLVRKTTCYACPVACRNINRVNDGRFRGLIMEGPEYETLALAGSNCGIGDLSAIMKFNDLCDDYGLDTISTGNVAGFLMECYEKGLITSRETEGLEFRFGSIEGYLEIPYLIANRKGIGKILADGVSTAAKKIGGDSERFAMQCKGLEYPGYDPRGATGMALAYATSDRGACHMRGYLAFSPNPLQAEGKAAILIGAQNRSNITNSLIRCSLSAIAVGAEARLYTFATGIPIENKDLQLIGDRIWNLVRIINVREGFSRADDTIPRRLVEEQFSQGPASRHAIPMKAFDSMLNEYYHLRGWSDNGIPEESKLQALGIEGLDGKR